MACGLCALCRDCRRTLPVAPLVVGARCRRDGRVDVGHLLSWTDAKFGALANVVALIGVVYGFFTAGPASLRAAYERDVAGR